MGASRAPPGSQGLVDRKDGKVTPATANVQISSSGVLQGCQDPRALQVPTGSLAVKAAKETPARTASPGSPGSREPLVTSVPPGPKG